MPSYDTVIAGSRTISDYAVVCDAIDDAAFDVATVISGCADGVDTLGERWADEHDIPVERFPPAAYRDTADERGIPAPLVRNEAMADRAEALIAVWDGTSRGTQHMLQRADEGDLVVHLHRTDSHSLTDF